MAVVTAVVAGVAIAAGVASSAMQAKQQKKAAMQARSDQERANLLNQANYIRARGGDASSIYEALGYDDLAKLPQTALLPMYQDPGTEKALFDRAVTVYDAMTGQPVEMSLAQYQQIADQAKPAIDSGNALVDSIFSGGLEERRLGDLQPVLDARTNVAEVNAAAIDLALNEERNRIMAQEAAKGYVGGGSFRDNRLLASTIGARQDAATGRAMVELENSGDVRAVKDAAIDQQLRSLNLPIDRATQLVKFAQLPRAAVNQDYQMSLQPFSFFRMAQGQPPTIAPLPTDTSPSMGAVALSGVAQAAGGVSGYLGGLQTAKAINNQTQSITTQNAMMAAGQMPENWGALTPQQQQEYMNMWRNAQMIPTPSGGWG